jgi:uncharacterized membrane protein YtjA (UPF0391 family)
MKILKIYPCIFLISLVTGCSRQDVSVDKCALSSSYKVSYLGASSGDGDLKFTNNENNLNYQITIFDSFVGLENPTLEFGGIAKCASGIVSGAIEAGNSTKSNIKILGGNFTGIFNQPLIEKPFGKWTLSLYDTEANKEYRFTGFWEIN